MKRGAPLFAQVLGLVIVSLIAAQAISIAVILSLPPPPPEPFRLSEVARALAGPGVTPTTEGRPLVARLRDAPPPERRLGRRRADFRDQLAEAMGVEPERIVMAAGGPRHFAVRGPRTTTRSSLPPSAWPCARSTAAGWSSSPSPA